MRTCARAVVYMIAQEYTLTQNIMHQGEKNTDKPNQTSIIALTTGLENIVVQKLKRL